MLSLVRRPSRSRPALVRRAERLVRAMVARGEVPEELVALN